MTKSPTNYLCLLMIHNPRQWSPPGWVLVPSVSYRPGSTFRPPSVLSQLFLNTWEESSRNNTFFTKPSLRGESRRSVVPDLRRGQRSPPHRTSRLQGSDRLRRQFTRDSTRRSPVHNLSLLQESGLVEDYVLPTALTDLRIRTPTSHLNRRRDSHPSYSIGEDRRVPTKPRYTVLHQNG